MTPRRQSYGKRSSFGSATSKKMDQLLKVLTENGHSVVAFADDGFLTVDGLRLDVRPNFLMHEMVVIPFEACWVERWLSEREAK